jgi:integrase
MKNRYFLYKRPGSDIWYCEDMETGKQASLRTTNKAEAERLVSARNAAVQTPELNRQLSQIYASADDPEAPKRTWRVAMDEITKGKTGSTRRRYEIAMKDRAFDIIRDLPILQTKAHHFLKVLDAGGVATNVFLRRIHNFALDMDWTPKPIIPKRQWRKVKFGKKRAITLEEHRRIVERELNPPPKARGAFTRWAKVNGHDAHRERAAFYELLWETGGAQSDVACLNAEDINWEMRLITFNRKKTANPSRIRFGKACETTLRTLPTSGPLFPQLRKVREADRATEFKQRCEGLGIKGVTPHSYRYAWAQRARLAGMPKRFAQEALGQNSAAVHDAYAKDAEVIAPSIEEYEQKVVRLPAAVAA